MLSICIAISRIRNTPLPMARPKYDWSLGKALSMQGLTHADIAKRLGCSTFTVQKKAQHENWNDLPNRFNQAQPLDTHKEAVDKWLEGITELLERVTANAIKLGSAKSRKDLRDDADTLRTLIVAGRQHFGLDSESSSLRIGIQVGKGQTRLALVGNADCQLAVQVLDAQSSSDDGKAKGMEDGGIIDVKGNPPAAPAGDEPAAEASLPS
jgi:hypothetical protein